MIQMIFGALWDFADEIKAGKSVQEFDSVCKEMRNCLYRSAKKDGKKAHRFVLKGQLRQYWSFGVPCGLSCNCYGVNIYD